MIPVFHISIDDFLGFILTVMYVCLAIMSCGIMSVGPLKSDRGPEWERFMLFSLGAFCAAASLGLIWGALFYGLAIGLSALAVQIWDTHQHRGQKRTAPYESELLR